jgi:hypothetical protein
VVKNEKVYHELKFNNDYDNPLILNEGWKAFKEFYKMSDNVLIVFEYYGHGLFGVLATGDRENLDEIPAFHSRSEHQHSTAIFDVNLTGQHFDAPKLVNDYLQTIHLFILSLNLLQFSNHSITASAIGFC